MCYFSKDVYTNLPNIYFIWPSIDGATVTSVQDIQLLQSSCTQCSVVCYFVQLRNELPILGHRSLPAGTRSNGLVESVYKCWQLQALKQITQYLYDEKCFHSENVDLRLHVFLILVS